MSPDKISYALGNELTQISLHGQKQQLLTVMYATSKPKNIYGQDKKNSNKLGMSLRQLWKMANCLFFFQIIRHIPYSMIKYINIT